MCVKIEKLEGVERGEVWNIIENENGKWIGIENNYSEEWISSLPAGLQLGYMEKPWIQVGQWIKPHTSQETGRVKGKKKKKVDYMDQEI